MDPDASLMLQFKNGDISSFEELVKKHKQNVINIIYHFIGDKEEAEDLAIEVFLRVYQAREKYKPTAKFTTWLYKITTNLCLNKIRGKERHHTISLNKPVSTEKEEKELLEEIADPSPSPQKILEEREKKALIRKAIDSLPKKQKIATILRVYEGLSYKEISEILSCSVKSVERSLYWARNNLKEKLTPYFTSETSEKI
ncbi:RNA polymerase sigma factor [Candidatus Aerophobetes bacterium]|nr:RNA polymerase sigma factor [Candidatus Aerophobetes bacterium]